MSDNKQVSSLDEVAGKIYHIICVGSGKSTIADGYVWVIHKVKNIISEWQSQQTKPGLRWVKASERLPTIYKKYTCEDKNGNVHNWNWSEEAEPQLQKEIWMQMVVKWLDESGETPLPKPVEDKCEHEALIDTGTGWHYCPSCGYGNPERFILTPKPVSEEGWAEKLYNELTTIYGVYSDDWDLADSNRSADVLHDYQTRNIP